MDRGKAALAALLSILFTFSAVWAASPKLWSVQVKQGQVRAAPSFLGRVVATLSYADPVTVVEEKAAWRRVARPQGPALGWMHVSALSSKRIVLRAGAADVKQAAATGEVALAGKGFNQQVEDAYRTRNRDLNYVEVDRMEQWVVSPEQMERFAREGELATAGGRP
jgi:SH3-like domain-containing protein